MLGIIQAGALILIGAIIGEIAVWSYHKGRVWWVAALSAVIAYTTVLSGFFFKDEKIWLYKVALLLWNTFLAQPVTASITFGILCMVAVGGAIWLYKTWPKSKNRLLVQVYEGSPVPGNYKIGAEVDIHALITGLKDKGLVGDDGVAVFELKHMGPIALTVTLARHGKLQTGGIPGVNVESLPRLVPIDILDIPGNGWLDAEAAPVLSVGSSVRQALPAAAATEVGKDRFKADNAPYGIPAAEIIINRPGYILGYDPNFRIPRWVAYRLSGKGRKSARRPDGFLLDPDIDVAAQASRDDYRASGYDYGHLVSLRDVRFRGQAVMNQASYMSTIAPQTPACNRYTWLKVEEYCRSITKTCNEIFVLAGTVFLSRGTGRAEHFLIGPNKVAVPTHFFRIITRKKNNGTLETLAFLVPNTMTKEDDISLFLTSVGQIEKVTGLTFLCNVDTKYKKQIAKQKADSLW